MQYKLQLFHSYMNTEDAKLYSYLVQKSILCTNKIAFSSIKYTDIVTRNKKTIIQRNG